MPRSHLFLNKWRLVIVLLALIVPLFLTSWQAEAQRKKPARRPTATPAATPQTGGAQQTEPKSQQKINLVRMRGSDTSDGSNVTLESDGVMNKYSAYRKDDRFYVVVPDLDAQRAQGNLRGRGFENVQVQKSGNDTVLVFRLQPGAKASVRQRFNRLDVVFNTPGGATSANQGNANQSQGTSANSANQGGTRTSSTQTQGGTSATPQNNTGTTGGSVTPSTNAGGNQTPNVNPNSSGTAPGINTAPTPAGVSTETPAESPAASPEATPPPDQIAQVTEAPAAAPPTGISQQPSSTSPSLATTLVRNYWGLALIIGLVLISLGLVIAARARSRRDAPVETVKETTLAEAMPEPLVTRKPKVIPAATTTAVTATPVLKKADREKARAAEKKAADESVVKETSAKEAAREVVADKDAAKEVVPVTMADIESASAEVKKLLAGESYDEAVVGTSDKGTRQAVAAELLGALASRNVERRERARTAFIKHNYLDEATYDLRTAEAPAERSSAARALGLSQDKTATPHLVAALEDPAPEVRRAAIEALAELRDSSAIEPLEALLKSEQDRKVSHSLIRRAIEASTIAVAVETQEETPTLEAAAPVVEEKAQAVSDKEETPTVETPTLEAAPVASGAAESATTETAVVASEAALSSIEATPVQTPAEVSLPLSGEIVAPQQRSGSRKMRKKQARQKRADEQARKLAEMEATRQKGHTAAAQAVAEAEAARLFAEEQERQRVAEEEARKQEEARKEEARKQEEARLEAEAEAQRLEAEAQRQAEEAAARERAEEEARRQAEEEAARLKAEEEAARLRAEEEERQHAEAEAQRLAAEEEERQRAEAEAARKAEEEAARLRAEEEERRQAEEARQRAEAEAARLQAEEEAARLRAEEERQRVEEEARLQSETEERRRVEEERKRLEAEAARQREEEEARQREEEERQRVEAEARARAEEARLKAEAEAQRKAEEEAARIRVEAERTRAEEEARQQAEAEARLRAEEEAARQRAEEEARRQAEEEAARLRAEEEAARLRAEEEAAARLQAEEEARRQAEEEERRAAEEVETVQVTEADVITPDAPHVSSIEPLIERNDSSAGRWFDIEVGHADVSPVSPVASELSSVALDSSSAVEEMPAASTTEWELGESQAPAHEAVASTSIEAVEEAQAEVPREIDVAVAEKGLAEPEFSTVPNSILRRLGSEDSSERAEAVADLGRLGGDDAFREISAAFDDPAQEVRNAAARSLFALSTDRAASFTRALREAPVSRRRNIGASLASSGLAGEAISHLMGESREKTYDAFSLLFLMSKAGEVQPLMRAIEEHPNNEVRLAVVKLLALSGQQEILPAFRRLAVRGSLPTEVRSAVMEAIYQISSQAPSDASTRV